MKLNYRRTVLVGLAFFSICAFWQMYNNVIPLILTNTFHVSEAVSGVIMAADNVLALFLLPLFGAVSDRSRCRMGRRMPFILAGTVGAVVLMQLLPFWMTAMPPRRHLGKRRPLWECWGRCWW